MHVLILPSWYPSYPGDIAGSFFREQALALVRKGCKVAVVSPKLRSLLQWKTIFTGRYGMTIDSDLGILTYRYYGMNWIPFFFRRQAFFYKFKTISFLKKYIKEQGMPDIIHVHSMLNAGLFALQAKKKFNIPYIITEHSSNFSKNQFRSFQLKSAAIIAKHAHFRLAVSNSLRSTLHLQLKAWTESTWDVLPNIVNQHFFQHPIVKSSHDSFIFLTISNLKPIKKVDHLIEAFAQAFKGEKKVILKIGGNGSELVKLKSLASSLSVSSQVEFLGMLSREQVVKEMALTNVFVLSSDYETFSVVIIEALALGKPIISTRCGGPEDIVNEKNGCLVEVGNTNQLADALRYIKNNYSSYNADEIREDCRRQYSEQIITDGLMELYKKASNSFTK